MFNSSTLSVIALLAAASFSSAASLVVGSEASDRFVALNLDSEPVLGSATDTTLMIGDDNPQYNKGDAAGIMVFELPDLVGEVIADAWLDLTLTGSSHMSSTTALDVYGVRYASSSAVLTTDYGFGPTPGNGTLIQDNIYDEFGGVMEFPIHLSTEGSNLSTWLSDLYQGGALAGDYAFIRLNLDVASANPARIASADHENAAYHPTLTITTVPEPSTYAAIFGLGALGFAILRRRTKQAV